VTIGRLVLVAGRSARRPQLGGNAVLAAFGGCRGGGPEQHLFLLPGGVESDEVVGVFLAFLQQRRHYAGQGFGGGQGLQAGEHRGVGCLAVRTKQAATETPRVQYITR
jgi:hypothetical protein